MDLQGLNELISKKIDSEIKRIFPTLFSFGSIEEDTESKTMVVNVKRNGEGDEYQIVVGYETNGEQISVDFVGAKLKDRDGDGCLSYRYSIYSEQRLSSLVYDMVQHLKVAKERRDISYNKNK